MSVLRSALCAGLFFVGPVLGAAAEERVWTAKVEVLMVAVKPSTALTLIPQLRDEKTSDTAFQKLQRMMERDEAEVLGWPIVTTRSGTRAVAETVEEVRYPIGTEPPAIPQNFGPIVPNPPMLWYPWIGTPVWGPITHTSFETRSCGPSLEIQPSVSEEGAQIALNLVAQHVYLAKFHEFRGVKNPIGIEGRIPQPEFVVHRLTSALTARNDQWMLLSNFSEQKPVARIVLFLLRARSIPGFPNN